ncbi:FHA domain-containing protein [Nakamurella antarctica]|uniref:FHA domain-containing protein n=1 Tax=Nakamurella antarctica TaxID=1902245 RepID=A0A3G8ZI24_9ACTN|nr:FHA domain-containing protein [Nakamurella antarctica]AZI56943.1 FHA domain-containing protein [Nakamurella antarctica]
MPAVILQLTRVGFLILLWLFVLAVIRVIRADMRVAAASIVAEPSAKRARRQRNTRPAPAPSGPPRQLVVTAGHLAGTRIALSQNPILIGRADDSTLVLDDDFASTRHARLTLQGQSYWLEDLGSTNGTYVDRTRVSTPVPIPALTPIRIGRTVFELRP